MVQHPFTQQAINDDIHCMTFVVIASASSSLAISWADKEPTLFILRFLWEIAEAGSCILLFVIRSHME